MSNYHKETYDAVIAVLNEREHYVKSLANDPKLGKDFRKTIIKEVRLLKDLRFQISYQLGFHND